MVLLHDMMVGRDYGQLKDLSSDRSWWRQGSKWECVSETCWKHQKTKEEGITHRVFSHRIKRTYVLLVKIYRSSNVYSIGERIAQRQLDYIFW